MTARGHQFVPLEPFDKLHGCNSCRGGFDTKPRAVIGFRYSYVTGRAGRVTWAQRGLCMQHAEKAAEKYGLVEQLERVIKTPMEVKP